MQSAMDVTFVKGGLTLGLLFPIESYVGDIALMNGQEDLAQRAESLGFTALWFRDVPLRVPSFGDVGQVFDPFVYISWIAACTKSIKLGTAATILPLRHPIHTAKMAASIDQLSNGRLLLGVASGDRAQEYPAFNRELETRDLAFRESFEILRSAGSTAFPSYQSEFFGHLTGQADILPKPAQASLPLLVVGGAQQSLSWIAENASAWLMYPRPLRTQAQVVAAWQEETAKVGRPGTPFGQSLYIDLSENPSEPAQAIHLGFRSGRDQLLQHLMALRSIGVSHIILNLKYSKRSARDVIEEIGKHIIPEFQ
jgi:luciferase-type oxidoreductase